MVHLMIREMKTIVKWLAITQQLYQNSMKNLKILLHIEGKIFTILV